MPLPSGCFTVSSSISLLHLLSHRQAFSMSSTHESVCESTNHSCVQGKTTEVSTIGFFLQKNSLSYTYYHYTQPSFLYSCMASTAERAFCQKGKKAMVFTMNVLQSTSYYPLYLFYFESAISGKFESFKCI